MLVTVVKSPFSDVQSGDIGEAAQHKRVICDIRGHKRNCRCCNLWWALGHLFRTKELKRS